MSAASDDGDVDQLAAEYVVGTLDAAERASFTSRLAHDEVARRALAEWERRLAPLSLSGDEVSPPAELWARIENALASSAGRRFRVIAGRGPDPAALLRSRSRWRGLALASSGIAAMLAVFISVRELQPVMPLDPTATYVAAVNRGGDKPALIVAVDLKTRQVLVRPVAARAPAGHSLELWYIGTGGTPRSMGLVSDATAHVAIPAGAAADEDATFAVTVEPPGGSKTGGPTGAVLYSGQLIKE